MITTRALAPDDGPVIERLFGANGACGGCWCVFYRVSGPEFKAGKGDVNKARFLALVRDGVASGVLAFDGERPVGWCAVAPREQFARIVRGPSYRKDAPAGTWSLNCFYVPRAERDKGVATALLAAAVELAFARGHRDRGLPGRAEGGRQPARRVHLPRGGVDVRGRRVPAGRRGAEDLGQGAYRSAIGVTFPTR